MFTGKDLRDSGNWQLKQIYRCKTCSTSSPYYSFGNLGWAALHEKFVHKKELTQDRLKTHYAEMRYMDILRALI